MKSFLDAGKQMEKIKGRPILTSLDWSLDGNACGSKGETRDQSASAPANAGDLVSSVTGMFTQKNSEDTAKTAAGQPILSFSVEVKKLAIEPVHDSEFAVPANYKLVPQL
jgi:hypothetical protein